MDELSYWRTLDGRQQAEATIGLHQLMDQQAMSNHYNTMNLGLGNFLGFTPQSLGVQGGEYISVRCQYCGTRPAKDIVRCESCGAPR